MAAPEKPICLLPTGLNKQHHHNYNAAAAPPFARVTFYKRWLLVAAFFCLMAPMLQAQEVPATEPDSLETAAIDDPMAATTADSTTTDKKDLLLPNYDAAFGDYAFRKKKLAGTWNRTDSFVDVRQLEVFSRLHHTNFGALPLSNIGHAVQLLQFSMDTFHLSDFTIGTTEQEFRTVQQLDFYDVKTPVADMQFITGYGRGQHFRLNYTQNLGNNTNYFLSFDRVNSQGNYANNRALVDDFVATVRHESANRRLSIDFAAQFNQRKLNEYGGIADLDGFIDNTNANRGSSLTNLTAARSTFLRNQYFSQQRYVLFRSKKDFLVAIDNTMDYNRRRYTFENDASTSLPPPVAGLPTFDSLTTHQYDQRTGLTFGKQLATGARQELRAFVFYHFQQLGGLQYQQYREALGLGGEGNYQDQKDRLFVNAQIRLNTIGNQAGSIVKGQVRFGKAAKLHFTGNFLLSGRTPDPFWETYRSNHYNWLNTNLDPVRNQRISLGAHFSNRFGIEASQLILQNWMYLDTASLPAQSGSTIFIQQIAGKANFRLKRWNWDNQALFQSNQSGGYDVIRLPQWVLRSKVYFNYSILKGVLKGQIGVDAHYFSAYQMDAYNPVLARFHLQDRHMVGNFPYVHAFATAQLKTFQFFIRFENVTPGLSGYDYFAAPLHPLPDRFLRFGFNWRFFE